MNKLILLTALTTLSFSSLANEAFGIKMGEPMSKYPTYNLDGVDTVRPPLPHKEFKYYFTHGTKQTGICKVIVATPPITTSEFGSNIKIKYSEFKSILASKYPLDNKDYEYLTPGSIWNEPRDFMMGLLKKDRYHSAAFNNSKGTKVILGVTPLGRTSAFLKLSYEFKNFDECVKIIEKRDNSSL